VRVRSFFSVRRWLAALSGFLVLFAGCRTIDRTLEHAHIPCGLYRWRIKTLSDFEAESVRRAPIEAQVRDLASLPLPAWFDRRHRNANEFYVYRVKAILVEVHTRLDQDIHLLLRDPADPKSHMVAEVPNPNCTVETRHDPDLAAARQVAHALKSRRSETLVEVVGVGFFDEFHEAKGSAPNGFELHPVLQLTELRPSGD
jgi:hypothetical protein